MSEEQGKKPSHKVKKRPFVIFRDSKKIVVVPSLSERKAISRRYANMILSDADTLEAEKRFVVAKRSRDKAVETFIYHDSQKQQEPKRSPLGWFRFGR